MAAVRCPTRRADERLGQAASERRERVFDFRRKSLKSTPLDDRVRLPARAVAGSASSRSRPRRAGAVRRTGAYRAPKVEQNQWLPLATQLSARGCFQARHLVRGRRSPSRDPPRATYQGRVCTFQHLISTAYVFSHQFERDATWVDLEGKIAVITGANKRHRFGQRQRFAAEGYQVVITGPQAAGGWMPANRINRRRRSLAVQGEHLEPGRSRSAFRNGCGPPKGRIDVLFANAGPGRGYAAWQDFRGKLREGLQRQRQRHAVLRCRRASRPGGPGGSIILRPASTTDVGGTAAFSACWRLQGGDPKFLPAGWAVDLKGTGIRVNVR